jgi:hypothetical protein
MGELDQGWIEIIRDISSETLFEGPRYSVESSKIDVPVSRPGGFVGKPEVSLGILGDVGLVFYGT